MAHAVAATSRDLLSEQQEIDRRKALPRETSVFLAAGGGVILLAHGIDLLHAHGPNWAALAIRIVWALLLGGQAIVLRRPGLSARAELVGTAAVVIGSAVLDVAILAVTGGASSPLLPFTFVLAVTMPVVAYQWLSLGMLGSGMLMIGAGVLLSRDHASTETIIAFGNAGGGALLAGWLLGRSLARARNTAEARHLELREAFRANEQLLRELREAMSNIKTLRGLLPICAWCRRIRDDKGYWERLEPFIVANSEAQFTHGMCPDCSRRVLAEEGELP